MSRFRILPAALADVEDAVAWYERRQAGLGAELLGEIEARISTAIELPGAGSLSGVTAQGSAVRRYRLARFQQYSVMIATIGDVPTVVALAHARRRPGFWRERLD